MNVLPLYSIAAIIALFLVEYSYDKDPLAALFFVLHYTLFVVFTLVVGLTALYFILLSVF